MERAKKAYKNEEFLNSPEARPLRILAEYLEPEKRFREANIRNTVVFFGSARVKENDPDSENRELYWKAEKLAFMLGEWFKELNSKKAGKFAICSGGGPGIMEAANRGASRAGALSIGLNISLPHEQLPNDFITPELNFEFHYFFMRKLWFMYFARAAVFFPGGFGTMDELFEVLTLIQTCKIERIPIVLFDQALWGEVVDFEKMVEKGYIARKDYELMRFFDDVEGAFEYLKSELKLKLKL